MPTNLELEKQVEELKARVALAEKQALEPPKLLRARPTRPPLNVPEPVKSMWESPLPTGTTVRIKETSDLFRRVMFGEGIICTALDRDKQRCEGEVEWVENEPKYRCTTCNKVARLKVAQDVWHRIREEGMLGTIERFKGNVHRDGEVKFSVFLPGISQLNGEGVRYSDLEVVQV